MQMLFTKYDGQSIGPIVEKKNQTKQNKASGNKFAMIFVIASIMRATSQGLVLVPSYGYALVGSIDLLE